jgi:hypothetical protein
MVFPPFHIPGFSYWGFGATVVTTGIRWRFPQVPHYISTPLVVAGLGLMVMPFLSLRLGTAASLAGAAILIAFAAEWQLAKPTVSVAQEVAPQPPPNPPAGNGAKSGAHHNGSHPQASKPSDVVGLAIDGTGGTGGVIESHGEPGNPSTGAEISAFGRPGQNVTGLHIIQNGPGTGLRIVQSGPGTGLKITTGVAPPPPQNPQ